MLGKLSAWFKALSIGGKVGVIAAASVIGLAAASPNTAPTPTQPPAQKNPTKTLQRAPECKASTSYTINTQIIPFGSSSVNESTLPQGQTEISTVGVNGEKQIKHELTKYTPAGCSVDTDVVASETVTKQPINQVTNIGTYIAPSCPNGTYVNSAGNTVCSPYSSSSAPAGATAQCADGSYSFSQSRSGTCSHHGGVSSWL